MDYWGTRFNENPPTSTLTPSHIITAATTTTPNPTLPTSRNFSPYWYTKHELCDWASAGVGNFPQGHRQEEQIAPDSTDWTSGCSAVVE
jgi:hypothetical protein